MSGIDPEYEKKLRESNPLDGVFPKASSSDIQRAMADQTEKKTHEQIKTNMGYLWAHGATIGKDISPEIYKKLEQAYNAGAEHGEREAIQFGRWLLKCAEATWDDNNALGWTYQGEFKNTDELLEIFRANKGLF